MTKATKMSDIAKRFNVSNVTVSKALSDKDGVSAELREKIKAAAVEMGYRYNTAAKSLKEGRNYNIGVLIPERFIGINTSFYWTLHNNIAKELMGHNYYCIMEVLKPEDEAGNQLPRIIQENKVDGVIILGQTADSYIKFITAAFKSLVFLDFYDKNVEVDTILTDNFFDMYRLTDYVLQMGHRKLAFVGSIKATSSIQDRYMGYLKALVENNIPLSEAAPIEDRDTDGMFIDIPFPKNMPTAFICNCDDTAMVVMKKLAERGYSIPGDISVVGFDNHLMSELYEPQITTVAVNISEMAKTAVELILNKISHPNAKPQRRLISGSLLIRSSVKKN